MYTNHLLNIAGLVSVAGLLGSCNSSGNPETGETNKLNFIFILVDDMGWKDAACYGSDFHETPNLDKLASEGVLFTDAYASCPVCSPTRASIFTGKYTVNHGVTDYIPGRQNMFPAEKHRPLVSKPFRQQMALEEFTLAEAMKSDGYITCFAGKWHLGKEGYFPEDQGFDFNYGGCESGGPYGQGGYFYPWPVPGLDGEKGEYLTDKLTSLTIDFMNQYRDTSFFAFLSFYTLHNPIMAPDSLVEKYKKKAEKLGYSRAERFDTNRTWIHEIPPHVGDYKLRKIQDNAVYAAMVEIMDMNIGRLMNFLKKSRLDKNTVVIFTADNGGLSTSEGSNTSVLPLRGGKGWLYEGGIREPLIIKWPGVTNANTVSPAIVTSTDFYPTILEMAGLDALPQQHTDGLSIVNVLKGQEQQERAVFWHYPHVSNQGGGPGSVVRKGDFKLIYWMEDDKYELYNLKEDIGEQHDLSEQLPDKLEEFKGLLSSWLEATNAKGMETNPDYEYFNKLQN